MDNHEEIVQRWEREAAELAEKDRLHGLRDQYVEAHEQVVLTRSADILFPVAEALKLLLEGMPERFGDAFVAQKPRVILRPVEISAGPAFHQLKDLGRNTGVDDVFGRKSYVAKARSGEITVAFELDFRAAKFRREDSLPGETWGLIHSYTALLDKNGLTAANGKLVEDGRPIESLEDLPGLIPTYEINGGVTKTGIVTIYENGEFECFPVLGGGLEKRGKLRQLKTSPKRAAKKILGAIIEMLTEEGIVLRPGAQPPALNDRNARCHPT